jgi:hypothetical protein
MNSTATNICDILHEQYSIHHFPKHKETVSVELFEDISLT